MCNYVTICLLFLLLINSISLLINSNKYVGFPTQNLRSKNYEKEFGKFFLDISGVRCIVETTFVKICFVLFLKKKHIV